MKIIMFYHSLLSDWNHGNAHFLRGIATELIDHGNEVEVYEPANSWSYTNMIADNGEEINNDFYDHYPLLKSNRYDPKKLNLDKILIDADLVIVHEWNEPALISAIAEKKENYSFKILFHDTHHRAATDKSSMNKFDLHDYDGVLVFGEKIKKIYEEERWAKNVWTWHEAADTRIFKPLPGYLKGDLVWIGNWGDNERTKELFEFIIDPVKELKLKATFYGVRYPPKAIKALKEAGINYGGWLPNYKVPEVFAGYRFTVHVPRRPYVEALPGIPTIRPFEALSCGIPLISAPWNDIENLFRPGKDFVFAHNKNQMKDWMNKITTDDKLAESLSAHGIQTILKKHTCAHRVDELYTICDEIGVKNILKQKIEK